MTDPAAPPSREELEAMTVGDPAAPTPFSLPTVPSGAPLLRMLEAELRAAAQAQPPGSALQGALERVLRGETDLRGLLADPAFPSAAERADDPGLRQLVETVRENEEIR